MNRHFIDYNAPAPKYSISAVNHAIPEKALEAARKEAQEKDAEAYKKMIPPAPPKPREAPYQPEGFSYAHVNSKGQQEAAIPAREEKPEPTVWYSDSLGEWFRKTPSGGNQYKTTENGDWRDGIWPWERLLKEAPDLTPF